MTRPSTTETVATYVAECAVEGRATVGAHGHWLAACLDEYVLCHEDWIGVKWLTGTEPLDTILPLCILNYDKLPLVEAHRTWMTNARLHGSGLTYKPPMWGGRGSIRRRVGAI